MYGTDGWAQNSENLQLNNIHDLVLIRFADVLLMQSELKENTDGINRVRERAGLSPISSYSLQAKRAPLGTRIREHSMERYPPLAYSRRRIGKADQRENIHQWPRGL